MFFKKNDQEEIEKLEARLKSLYDEYTLYYHGPKDASVAFHTRYIEAIKKGLDLTRFLEEEKVFAEQLIAQIRRTEEKNEEKPTILAEIALKRQEAIAAYPEISYFEGMDLELRKFFGVMKQCCETDFPDVEKILKYKHGHAMDTQLDKIQSELTAFVPKSASGVPAALVRYKIFVSGSATAAETEKEKNQILQRGASLLKGINQFLHQEMRKNQTISLGERKTLINKENYIDQILDDFRIRDIATAMNF